MAEKSHPGQAGVLSKLHNQEMPMVTEFSAASRIFCFAKHSSSGYLCSKRSFLEVHIYHSSIEAPHHREDWYHSCGNVSTELMTKLSDPSFWALLDKEHPIFTQTVGNLFAAHSFLLLMQNHSHCHLSGVDQ